MKNQRLINRLYGMILRVMFLGWHRLSVIQRRKRMRIYNFLTPINANIEVKERRDNSVPVVCINQKEQRDGLIFYLHGGAYVLGMTNNHINLCGKLAESMHAEVIAPKYRLAPDHPFPSALLDVVSIYKKLITEKDNSLPLYLGGDSAGGGLALALLQEIRDNGYRMPDKVFLISPWTDLTLTSDSVNRNVHIDPVLSPCGLKEDAKAYAGDYPLDNPRISPHFGSVLGFPPILIQVGTNEILLDDAHNFAQNAQSQQVFVKLSEWQGLFHVFQMFPMLPAADQAIAEINEFLSLD